MDNALNDAEQAVLGGCIKDKNAYYQVIEKVSADDFLSPAHKIIFQDLGELIQKGGIGDAALMEYLNSKKDLERVGGQEYIIKLAAIAPAKDEMSYYVSLIKDKSLANRFFNTLHNLENEYNNKVVEDISDFIGTAEKQILDITSKRRVSEFKSPKEILTSLKEQMAEDMNMRQKLNITQSYLTGYPTGYEDVDRLTGGFHPADLIILAARPSVGKTALALNFAERMAAKGKTVGIFSLEMSAESILLRLLSEESSLPTNVIKTMDFSDLGGSNKSDAKLKLNLAVNQLMSQNLFIDDTSAQKLNDISSKARKLKARYPDLSLLVVDYLGLITNPTKGNAGNRQQEVSDITRGLKALARDLDVPILCLCQLSRGVETRAVHKPVLSDLRDSGSIEQDADMVFFIYREDYYKTEREAQKRPGTYQAPAPEPKKEDDNGISQVILMLEKNRNGKTGECYFTFFKPTCRFESIASINEIGEDPNQPE